jgi:hypothetical protein
MRVLLISFLVGLGVGILYGLIRSEESGAAHRRLARPLGNGDRRTVWDLGPDEKAGHFVRRIRLPCR